MSDLPLGWEWTTTRELFSFVTSGSRGWARYYSDEGAPFIRVGNLRRGSIVPDFAELQRVNPPKGSEGSRTRIQSNDILISITADLGRIALMSEVQESSYINQHVALARPVAEVNARYLAWYLSSDAVQRQWVRQQRGATKLGLGLDDIRSIAVPLPPWSEQHSIATAIEEQFSRLDVGIAALERARNNLDRMRASTYTAAVTGRLTVNSSESSEADAPYAATSLVSLGSENLRKVKRASQELLSKVWDVPSSWTWKPASEVCEVIASGSTPIRSAMTPNEGDIPYIKVYNLTRSGYLDFSVRPTFIDRTTHRASLRRSILFPGDILMNIVGPPLGKVSVVPSDYPEWNTNQAVVAFRPARSINRRLLKYWLLSPPVRKLIESTAKATAGQYNVSLTTCRALPLPMPPRHEQDLIVAAIEDRLSIIDSQEKVINASITRAASLRSAILSAAFSGGLR